MEKNNNTQNISRSAISLAFCISCLLLFRGPVSIVAAFFIPAIIVAFSVNCGRVYYYITSAGLFFLTFLFFPTQVIFIIGYILLAIIIRILLVDEKITIKLTPSSLILYILSVVLILFLGIRLTEFFLKIPLHTMMLRFSQGKTIVYFGILFLESIFVVIFNVLVLKLLKSLQKSN